MSKEENAVSHSTLIKTNPIVVTADNLSSFPYIKKYVEGCDKSMLELLNERKEPANFKQLFTDVTREVDQNDKSIITLDEMTFLQEMKNKKSELDCVEELEKIILGYVKFDAIKKNLWNY